ncbi:hypothetical protein HNQ77_004075 [Silvibacterium bohemicum]|uniref:Peptidase M28 domain-containing protein n=1 Tax=Silvibacterium bohemicum TaxID=1577686 RepID=A0A841JZN3_9BACT|nr:M28 family peptidase [Silvibacterium bohemicum]MBB6146105.1 hypothetical protein [Silvibacterium bohemicum]
MRLLALLLILLSVDTNAPGQRRGLFFWTMPLQDIVAMVRHVPQDDGIRLAQLKQTFKDMQCTGEEIREQAFNGGANLVCTLSGSSPDTILFVAHYEHNGPGQSAVENWTGATTLPFLYHALAATPRKHTFVFLEVKGDAGAKSYLRSLSKADLHALKAVIAVDALGLGATRFYLRPIGFYTSSAESLLQNTLALAAQDKGLPPPQQEIPGSWLKIDDTKLFRFKGIPSILIHSVDRDTREIPGSEKDTLAALNDDAYFASYDMLCYYGAELDDTQIGAPADTTRAPSRGRR